MNHASLKPTARTRARGNLRIIGGQWRSRRIEVAALEGLRPTPDRVRQTLFDWLQHFWE
ncbi:MAG: 16S rRNA (guanine(966)-N(2))-methyltransferase RsmD, partial [Betaproteobacteria bacterium]|nr:16S rRNA (guanine(966)-N(2))-methyltransferase RsmD [Betaproteobacteria bacterium]